MKAAEGGLAMATEKAAMEMVEGEVVRGKVEEEGMKAERNVAMEGVNEEALEQVAENALKGVRAGLVAMMMPLPQTYLQLWPRACALKAAPRCTEGVESDSG